MFNFKDTFFLVVGTPPINGMTVVNTCITKKYGGTNLNHVQLIKKSASNEKLWRIEKWVGLIAGFLKFIFPARNKNLYIVSESAKGLVFTKWIVLVSKIFNRHVYLHHHVFSYINETNSFVMKISSYKNVTHIFLCERMRDEFISRYCYVNSIIIDNKNFFKIRSSSKSFIQKDKIKIGLLSNLNKDKGLYDFLTLSKNLDKNKFEFILAGPVNKSSDMDLIGGANVKYLGPVYKENKEEFYRDIDIFVFPTLYKNEAQPLVIYEALEAGKYVISYRRGCIESQISGYGITVSNIEEMEQVLNNYADHQ